MPTGARRGEGCWRTRRGFAILKNTSRWNTSSQDIEIPCERWRYCREWNHEGVRLICFGFNNSFVTFFMGCNGSRRAWNRERAIKRPPQYYLIANLPMYAPLQGCLQQRTHVFSEMEAIRFIWIWGPDQRFEAGFLVKASEILTSDEGINAVWEHGCRRGANARLCLVELLDIIA